MATVESSDGHPIERNCKTLITSGAHCLHKEIWLPILLIGFPDTCFLTFLEMSFTVWLVSDFVSTPFALKQGIGIPPLPLLNMFSFTTRTLRRFISAGITRSYFHRQVRMCLLFYTRKTTNPTFLFMSLFYFMSRRAVILIDWRPFPCQPCKPLQP